MQGLDPVKETVVPVMIPLMIPSDILVLESAL
jgi:hypothetical protein